MLSTSGPVNQRVVGAVNRICSLFSNVYCNPYGTTTVCTPHRHSPSPDDAHDPVIAAGWRSRNPAEHDIRAFLHADRIRDGKGDATDRVEQPLDHQHHSETEGRARKPQREPRLDRAGDPAREVKNKAGVDAGSPSVNAGDGRVKRSRAGSGSVQPIATKSPGEAVEQIERAPLSDQ